MADEGYVVRIRGLPWSCSVDEVQRFFSGKYSYIILEKPKCSFVLILIKAFLHLQYRLQNSKQRRWYSLHLYKRGAPQWRSICGDGDRGRPQGGGEERQRDHGSQICRRCTLTLIWIFLILGWSGSLFFVLEFSF